MNHDQAVWARQRLWNAVAVLASPPDAQAEWLKEIGTYPLADELVLEFDDCAQLMEQLVEDGMLSAGAASVVAELVIAIDALQTSGIEWEARELTDSPHWARVRRAAGFALVELAEAQPV